MPKSFRIFNQAIKPGQDFFLRMRADIEYRPDDIHVSVFGRVFVQVETTQLSFIAKNNEKHGMMRLCYYAIENLKEILAKQPLVSDQIIRLEPSANDLTELLKIDPLKIRVNDWILLNEKPVNKDHLIFISCGQQNPAEKNIGKRVKELIEAHSGFRGYFAENQQSLEGLTNNIFNSLHKAIGFVAIMHRRDVLTESQYRASVWIEQEVAIAAFMLQTLNLPIAVKAYIQRGVKLEGVRNLIQLNPQIFETEQELTSDLEKSLPIWLSGIKSSDKKTD